MLIGVAVVATSIIVSAIIAVAVGGAFMGGTERVLRAAERRGSVRAINGVATV